MANPGDPRDQKITEWVRSHRDPADPTIDTDAAWSRFIRQHDMRSTDLLRRRRRLSIAGRIAAVLVAAAGIAYWQLGPHGKAMGPNFVSRTVPNGQRATLALGDGINVTLNGGSRLLYPVDAKGDRDLYLQGEGFFEVAHNPKRALRVHAAHGIVTDVGTKFNVTAYANHPGVEVVVTEGSVTLASESSPARTLALTAGQVGVLGPGDIPQQTPSASLDRYVGWTKGTLVLEDKTLRDAVLDLQRWYGVRVVVRDQPLSLRTVAGQFHGEPVEQVLDAIALALDARWTKQDSTYTLLPRGR